MPVSGIFLYNSETSTISKATADTSTALIANVKRYDQCKVAYKISSENLYIKTNQDIGVK